MTLPEHRPCVLVLADGAEWEGALLPVLGAAGILVLRRCVDVVDLMAAAATRQANVVLVDGEQRALDADVVGTLHGYGVAVVAVVIGSGREDIGRRLSRIGVDVVSGSDPDTLVELVTVAAGRSLRPDPAAPSTIASGLAPSDPGPAEGADRARRVIAVWGPAGAPGRSTMAAAIADLRAGLGNPVVLVDADPYGGSLAQHLGVLDEASGILAAARLANSGGLEPTTLTQVVRRLAGGPHLLTGLPRAERRIEVRPGATAQVVATAAAVADVVVDTGFCLEDDDSGRDRMTLEALAAADDVVVVGAADPVGLTRLARGLTDLGDLLPGVVPHVLINRMRPSLGWQESDVVGMVGDYTNPAGVHLIPDDVGTADRASVSGRSVVDVGDSPLRRALVGVVAAVYALNSR